MKIAILCSWCDKPMKSEKTIVNYQGEFICRECYFNRVTEGHKQEEKQEWDISALIKKSIRPKVEVLGECKQCHFPIKDGQPHYERWGNEFLHFECAEKYREKMFKLSKWEFRKE